MLASLRGVVALQRCCNSLYYNSCAAMNTVFEESRIIGPLRDTLTGLAVLRDCVYIGTSDGTLTVYKAKGATLPRSQHPSPLLPLCWPPPLCRVAVVCCSTSH